MVCRERERESHLMAAVAFMCRNGLQKQTYIQTDRWTESPICWLLLYMWEMVAETETDPFADHCHPVGDRSSRDRE